MRPLPTVSEVFHPAPPQTSKRRGCHTTSCFLYSNYFPGRRLAGPPTAPGERLGSERKKGARKVCDLPGSQASELFALLLRVHNASSILRPVGLCHSLAKRQQIKNFMSAIGHNTPAVLQGGSDSHGAIALVWNGCAYKTLEYPACAEERLLALLDSTPVTCAMPIPYGSQADCLPRIFTRKRA